MKKILIITAAAILLISCSGTVQNAKGESLSITEGRIINGKLSPTINTY